MKGPRVLQHRQGESGFLWTPDGAKIAVMSGQSLGFALIPLPGGAGANFNSSGIVYYAHADWEGSWRLDRQDS